MKSTLKAWIVLLALLLPALFVNLGSRPVDKIQEVRVAETAREMLASGDWMVPRYNGELRLQKPPLPYWLTAATYRLAGVGKFATRLPAALFGLFAAVMLWTWMRREIGERSAANAALVLAASFLGLRYFRSGEADAVLVFFISAACLLGYRILHGHAEVWRKSLFGLMLGLGFLSKGPAALAIPVLTLVLMALIERRSGRLQQSARQFFSLPGLALLLVAGFGWYLWITLELPEAAPRFFGRQVDETFVSGNHVKPVWWYASHWFEFFAPWGVLLLPAAWMAYRRRDADTLPPMVRFAWIWLLVVFALLTATVNKQTQYALLFAPPLAVILGHYLAEASSGFAKLDRVLFALFCATMAAGVALLAWRKTLAMPADLIWLLVPLAPLLLRRLLRESSVSPAILCVAGLTSMAYLYSEAHLPNDRRKAAVRTVMAEAVKHDALYQTLGDGAISFYAGRVVPPVDAVKVGALLGSVPELWLLTERLPELAGVDAQLATQSGDLKLYRLHRRP